MPILEWKEIEQDRWRPFLNGSVCGDATIVRTGSGSWTGVGGWEAPDTPNGVRASGVQMPDRYATKEEGFANIEKRWRELGVIVAPAVPDKAVKPTPAEKQLAALDTRRQKLVLAIRAKKYAAVIDAIWVQHRLRLRADARARKATLPPPAPVDPRQAAIQAVLDKQTFGCNQAAVTELVVALTGFPLVSKTQPGNDPNRVNVSEDFDVVVIDEKQGEHQYQVGGIYLVTQKTKDSLLGDGGIRGNSFGRFAGRLTGTFEKARFHFASRKEIETLLATAKPAFFEAALTEMPAPLAAATVSKK